MEVEMCGESLAVAGAEVTARRASRTPWGTWEELVLGGAVLRHGTADWAPIAAELRMRFPYPFTPQECKAKYEDVQKRFSGFDAWFGGLRRWRVEELRRELEKSDDSIGSLQLKLESLKAERESDPSVDYDSGHTESPYPTENAEGTDLSSKEPSNDRSSAGSFIEETRSIWSPDPQIADSVLAQGKGINVEVSKDCTRNSFSINGDVVVIPGNLRKKRGARKSRFHNNIKEGSIGLSNSGCSTDNIEESKGLSNQNTEPCKQGPISEDSQQRSIDHHQDLGQIFDEIMQYKGVSLFRRQLESQKKARYRKMIRRHVDFQIIKSRISDGSISHLREVFRDLLLLSNNALVFYPKYTREYKSALILRELVMKRLREDRSLSKSSNVIAKEDNKMVKPEPREPPSDHKTTGNEPSPGKVAATKKADNSKMVKPEPREPPSDHKTTGDGPSPGKVTATKKADNSKKPLGAGIAPSSPPKKRGVGRPAKNAHRGHQNPKESPGKGRKAKR